MKVRHCKGVQVASLDGEIEAAQTLLSTNELARAQEKCVLPSSDNTHFVAACATAVYCEHHDFISRYLRKVSGIGAWQCSS